MEQEKLLRILMECGDLVRRKKLPKLADVRNKGASFKAAKRILFLLENIPATTDVQVEEGKFDDPEMSAIYVDPWRKRTFR